MNYLKNALDNYLINPDPVALQVRGKWGSGKTFYINSYFKKNKNIKSIIFSLFGFNDLQELKKELLLKIAVELDSLPLVKYGNGFLSNLKQSELNKHIIINSIGLLSNYFLNHYKDTTFKKNNQEVVIILDDLERLNSSVDLQDLMGFIYNEIIEKFNFKVIIISNEEKIDNKQFLLIKEKLISKTLEFYQDENSLKKILSEKISSQFLLSNLNWILNISLSQLPISEINLRTFFSIIYNFEFIENSFNNNPLELDKKYRNEYLKSVFLNVFVITLEDKLGNLSEDNLRELKKHDYSRFFWFFEKSNIENYWEKLLFTYHKKNDQFDKFILYSDNINTFVTKGIWIENNYREKWLEIFYPKDESKNENYDNLLNFYNYTEEEIKHFQTKLTHDSLFSNNNFFQVFNYYTRLLHFKKIDLLFIHESELEKIFNKLTSMLLNNTFSESQLSKIQDEITNYYSFIDVDSHEKLKKLIGIKQAQIHKDNNLKLIEAIFEDDRKTEEEISNNLSSYEKNLFSFLTDDELIMKYILCAKSKANFLSSHINRYYLQISNSYEYHKEEIPDIEILIKKIKSLYIEENCDRIDQYKIKQLLDKLEELKTHLNKSNIK